MRPKIILAVALALTFHAGAYGRFYVVSGASPGDWERRSLVLAVVTAVDAKKYPVVATLEIRATITGSLDPAATPRVTSGVNCPAEGARGGANLAMMNRPRVGTLVVALLLKPPGRLGPPRYFGGPPTEVPPRHIRGWPADEWMVEGGGVGFMPRGEPICEVKSFDDDVTQGIIARVRALRKTAATIGTAAAAAAAARARSPGAGTGAEPRIASEPDNETPGAGVGPRASAPPPGKIVAFDLAGKATLEMVLIRPGTFVMGDDQGNPDEKPAHRVTITEPFYLGRCKITDRQLESLLGPGTAVRKGAPDTSPTWAGWDTSRRFLDRLSGLHVALVAAGKSPNPRGEFRLPTEAEWEYACRAGTTTKCSFGDSEDKLPDYAWVSGSGTHPVGQKKPNPWGLYDMHGDVWEWCSDWYSDDYYRQSPSVDPQGPSEAGPGHARVLRGGGSPCGPAALHSAFRFWWTTTDSPAPPCAGLRVAMSAPDEPSLPPDQPAVSRVKVDDPKSKKAESREVKK